MVADSHKLAVVCILLTMGAPAVQAAQEVYRWVDTNGVIHYSQRPPTGAPYERMSKSGPLVSNPPSLWNPVHKRPAATATPEPEPEVAAATDATASAAPGEQALTPVQQQQRTALQAEAQARLSEITQAKRRNCDLAREQFREFTTYARIRVPDGSGGIRILADDERAERIAEAEEAIVLNCDDAG